MTATASHVIVDQHASIAAVLRSLEMMLNRGPCDEPERFFDVVRAMLFYIDEFPERQHHPKESKLLFPKLLKVAPELSSVIEALEADHVNGEGKVRELQHLLLAWELLGEARRPACESAASDYVRFYLEHMRIEEVVLLPAALRLLTQSDWDELNVAFAADLNPLGSCAADSNFNRLFTRIVQTAPEPIGLGPCLRQAATGTLDPRSTAQ